MPTTPDDVARAFIAAINAEDPVALRALMTEDHTFTDARGNSFSGAEKMQLGWQHFFRAYPGYRIKIEHTFTKGNQVALFGNATGGWRVNDQVLPQPPIEPTHTAGVKFSHQQEGLMRRISASLLILAATVTVAQTPPLKIPASDDITFRLPAAATGCPVGFNASRQGGLHALTASNDKKFGIGQGLHLTFDRLANPAIQSITVRVYITSPEARVLPLSPPSTETVTNTFTFERQTDTTTLHEADVWMPLVGSIRSAVLTNITFTDGTTWRPTEDLKCIAVPSLYLPVDAAVTKTPR